VVTDNTGSLAVRFDCTRRQDPALVVYDTASGSEVMRRPVRGCGLRYASCDAYALMGDHVYITWTHFPHGGHYVVSSLQLDLATDRVSKVELPGPPSDPVVPYTYDVAAKPYLDEIRNHPRGLVVGDSWETGTPTPFGWGFTVVGRRLVSRRSDRGVRHRDLSEGHCTLTARGHGPVRLPANAGIPG
jgi:hypothetical protein